ncbi:MAG: glycosyltransferase family protein [Chitinophagaceae bacterium]
MKILYAIQGTGNGHLSRARDIVPLLQRKGELDLIISGIQADISLPYPIKYRFKGLSFIFGKKGGVDLMQTYRKSNMRRLLTEINRLPVEDYDLIINDFEPVSAWACYIKSLPCISLSHQAAVLNKNAPRPKHVDMVGKALLNYYAPVTERYGFHFKAYDHNIFTPVIRQQVRELQPRNDGHYTVYLPAYDDSRIIKVLSACRHARWQVFSKHNKYPFVEKNVSVSPVTNDAFVNSLVGAEGVICGAGFETPAEALYLKKKLMVIPMKNQYEQSCNAAALKAMGVPVLKGLKKKYCDKINEWTLDDTVVGVDYPDNTSEIIDDVVMTHGRPDQTIASRQPGIESFSTNKLRKASLKKILAYLAT